MRKVNRKKALSTIMAIIMLLSALPIFSIGSFAKNTEIISEIIDLDGSKFEISKAPSCYYLDDYLLNRSGDYTIFGSEEDAQITLDDENFKSISKDKILINNLPDNCNEYWIDYSSLQELKGKVYFELSYNTKEWEYYDGWIYTEDFKNYYFVDSIPEKEYLISGYEFVTKVDEKYVYQDIDGGSLIWTSDFKELNYLDVPNAEPNYKNFGDGERVWGTWTDCVPAGNGFIIWKYASPVEEGYYTYLNIPEFYFTRDFVKFTKVDTSAFNNITADPNKNTSLYFAVKEVDNSLCLAVWKHNVELEYETHTYGNGSSYTYISGINDLSTNGSLYLLNTQTLSFEKWFEKDDDFGFIYTGQKHAIINCSNQKFIELKDNTVNEYNTEALNAKVGNNGIAYVGIWDNPASPEYFFGFTDNSIWYTEDFKTIYNFNIPMSNGKSITAINYTALGNCIFNISDESTYVLKIDNLQKAIDEYKATGYKGFPDVKKGDWYYDVVKYVAEKGFITGYQSGKFGPNDALKRQDFVCILARIDGADLSKYANQTSKLTDVKKGDYYAAAVNWAVDKGYISGYKNGKFGVNDPITREQVATILYNYMKKPTVTNATSILSKFPDANKVSSFAKTPVAWAVSNGVISGMGNGTVASTSGATRAQIAAIIQRMDTQGMFSK